MSVRLAHDKASPGAYKALAEIGRYLRLESALEPVLLGMVDLRASILNDCNFCIGLHTAELRRHHEPDSRIEGLRDWRSSDAFTPRERAALAWTDAVTTLENHVPDDAYEAVTQFFTGKDLADLTYAIAKINAWNRLGIAFRAEWKPPVHAVPSGSAAPAEPSASNVS